MPPKQMASLNLAFKSGRQSIFKLHLWILPLRNWLMDQQSCSYSYLIKALRDKFVILGHLNKTGLICKHCCFGNFFFHSIFLLQVSVIIITDNNYSTVSFLKSPYRTLLAEQLCRNSLLSMAPDTRLEASATSSVSNTFLVHAFIHTCYVLYLFAVDTDLLALRSSQWRQH